MPGTYFSTELKHRTNSLHVAVVRCRLCDSGLARQLDATATHSSPFFDSLGALSVLASKFTSPLKTIVIALPSTSFGFSVTVPAPSLTTAVPSVLVTVFFFFLVSSSKMTVPVGVPPPGEIGSISAVTISDLIFFFLRTGSRHQDNARARPAHRLTGRS